MEYFIRREDGEKVQSLVRTEEVGEEVRQSASGAVGVGVGEAGPEDIELEGGGVVINSSQNT